MLKDFSLLMQRTTPVIELSGVDSGSARVYAGLALMNPTGSVKDVMAWYMLKQAEDRGDIEPGDTILEITTGNTGIAFAMLSAIHGYRFVAVMPEHMSVERRQIMKAYGADVVLTPRDEDMPGALRRYEELKDELAPHVWLPNQFANDDNIKAHYEMTGTSLVRQLPEPPDIFVAGLGTGGTFVGVTRRLRETYPDCRTVAIEPAESAVLSGGTPGLHGIQGIGEGFVPEIIARNRHELDEIAVVSTAEAESQARNLVGKTGLLCGVSSGANIAVALRYAAKHPDAAIVTLIPDRGERYLNQGLFGCSPIDCGECCGWEIPSALAGNSPAP